MVPNTKLIIRLTEEQRLAQTKAGFQVQLAVALAGP